VSQKVTIKIQIAVNMT